MRHAGVEQNEKIILSTLCYHDHGSWSSLSSIYFQTTCVALWRAKFLPISFEIFFLLLSWHVSDQVNSCVCVCVCWETEENEIVSKLCKWDWSFSGYHSSVRIYIHSINFNYVITLRERDDEDDDEVLFLKHRFRTSRHMRQWPMGKDEQQQ